MTCAGVLCYNLHMQVATTTEERTMDFDTSEYVNSHGSKPRGYGSWGFLVACETPHELWVQATYSDAKREVKRRLRGTAVAYVLVLP